MTSCPQPRPEPASRGTTGEGPWQRGENKLRGAGEGLRPPYLLPRNLRTGGS